MNKMKYTHTQSKWDRAFGKALLSIAAILGLSTSLSAYEGGRSNSQTCRPTCRPTCPEPCPEDCPEICPEPCPPKPCKKKRACPPAPQRPANYGFAYPKDLNLCNPYDFDFHVEGLAFQAMETGTSFLIKNKSTPSAGSDQFKDASIGGFSGEDDNWDYNFGLRIGLGGTLNHDAWNLDATWTWLNMTDSEHFSVGSPGKIIPLWFPANDSLTAAQFGSSGGGTWKCKMNVLDVAMGKAYHISRHLIFNPHFGLRAAWLNQRLGAHYAGTRNPQFPTLAITDPVNIFHSKNDFWGFGARLGLDTDWIIGYGFKFFANGSASILSGKFKTNEHFILPSPFSLATQKLSDDYHMNVPNLDLALGVDWGIYLGERGYYLDFRAGYEFQVWWDQFNVRKITALPAEGGSNDTVSRGMLTLNGFTFRIQLDM